MHVQIILDLDWQLSLPYTTGTCLAIATNCQNLELSVTLCPNNETVMSKATSKHNAMECPSSGQISGLLAKKDVSEVQKNCDSPDLGG